MKNVFQWIFTALICIGLSLVAYDLILFQTKATRDYTTKLARIQELASAMKVYKFSPLDVDDFANKIIAESTVSQNEFQYTVKIK